MKIIPEYDYPLLYNLTMLGHKLVDNNTYSNGEYTIIFKNRKLFLKLSEEIKIDTLEDYYRIIRRHKLNKITDEL